jgi:hypothetical protein
MRIGNGQLGEEFAHANRGELKSEALEFVAGIVFNEINGEIELSAEEFEMGLVSEPILVTAIVPSRDVAFGDFVRERRVSGLFEELCDVSVGGAVLELVVD